MIRGRARIVRALDVPVVCVTCGMRYGSHLVALGEHGTKSDTIYLLLSLGVLACYGMRKGSFCLAHFRADDLGNKPWWPITF